jgi:putative flippase GtrA
VEKPWKRFGLEASRFLAVGLVATVVAFVLFNLLVHGLGPIRGAWLNDNPEVAYVVANGVGMLVSFRGTKVWAFRDRESKHPDGGAVAFVVINLATMLIPITCLSLSRGLGLDDPVSDNLSANVVGLGLANAARFFLFRTFVFLRVDDPDMTLDLEFSEPRPEGSTEPSTSDPAPPPAPAAAEGSPRPRCGSRPRSS